MDYQGYKYAVIASIVGAIIAAIFFGLSNYSLHSSSARAFGYAIGWGSIIFVSLLSITLLIAKLISMFNEQKYHDNSTNKVSNISTAIEVN
ncbi:MAG: hypothetical protein HN929_01335 [Chloroflexi bacterium]|jgi:uncharacterized membrane protein|nr:hypothetical protein [Chloroflexota bacterium]MBT7080105.1 hypothetical protein [Chloroflexota bacterium]MBT7290689.1 hypothetical protein [Chloroflexota bacterium]